MIIWFLSGSPTVCACRNWNYYLVIKSSLPSF